jgi:hypothetical protein
MGKDSTPASFLQERWIIVAEIDAHLISGAA